MAEIQGKLQLFANRLRKLLRKDIWEFSVVQDHSLRGQVLGWLRVFAIAAEGLRNNQLFSKAAALSYSTLLGIGPLIAIVVLFSGSFLSLDAELQIKRSLLFIAPSLGQYLTINPNDAVGMEDGRITASELDLLIRQIVQGAQDTMSAINTGGSTTFGILGFSALLIIGIQLLTSIETTFNEIWGVRRGRAWGQRLVFYWTLITLGAILGLGATALLSATTVLKMFEFIPLGEHISRLLFIGSPMISFGALTLLLTFAYQFFPNTQVQVRPALMGAAMTCILLFVNNYLSILYVHRVITLQSLYGSVGIIPVLMFGLYFFWVFILLGGQLTYAVQNASVLTNRQAWEKVSPRTRELVTLAALLVICRRFISGDTPHTLTELTSALKVPGNILNESLGVLTEMGWITTRLIQDADGLQEVGYQPARPLAKMSLAKFQHLFANLGNNDGKQTVMEADPLLRQYCDGVSEGVQKIFPNATLADLLGERD